MAYCTSAQVQATIPQFPITTWPAGIDADAEIAGINAEMDSALSGRGVTVPFVSDGGTAQDAFAAWLTFVARNGVAWRIVRACFPRQPSADESSAWADYASVYKAGLKGIKDGSALPLSVLETEDDVRPATLGISYPSTEVGTVLGGTENQPAFTRRRADTF